MIPKPVNRLRALFDPASNHSLRERGQGLLEFALIFPLLILLIMAILEFGIYFMTYFTIQNAVREGAREASITPELDDDDERIIEYIEGLLPLSGPFVGFEDGITLNGIDDCQVNNLVTVTVSGQYNFVALNVLGLNGITITMPSTTHYELCDQYTGTSATSTPGPSPTSAPSSTNTLVASLTPSRTPTPTITSTPSCPVIGGNLQYDGDDIRWNLTNTSGSTQRIASVYFEWIWYPYFYQYYDHMRFDGNTIHDGNDSFPNTDVSGGWSGPGFYRDLGGSQTKELNIDFAYTHLDYGVTIVVTFESGCVVSSATPPAPTAMPTRTNTPLPTSTPTRTPTPSRTPTPTLTPTPEACSVIGDFLSYGGGDDDAYWWLYNGGSSTERIVRVTFNWVDSPGSNYYDHMRLDGDQIHEGNDSNPPTSITGGWYGADWRRDISPGNWEQLNIDFRYSHVNYGLSIEVEFQSGCVVSTGG